MSAAFFLNVASLSASSIVRCRLSTTTKSSREVCNREPARGSGCQTGLPSRVLHLGQRPKQAIPQRRVLLQQSADVDSLGRNGFVFDTVRPSHARHASCCLRKVAAAATERPWSRQKFAAAARGGRASHSRWS